jgi:hypothetical protein
MQWFRVYHGLCTDPKLHRISRAAGCSRAVVIAAWLAVLETASQADERGSLGEFDAASLAFMVDVKPDVAERVLTEFRRVGMIVGDVVTAWTKRQREHDDASIRKKAERERKANLLPPNDTDPPGHVTVTPRSEQSRTDKKESLSDSPKKAARRVAEASGFDAFWQSYPRKVGKGAARKAWTAATKATDPQAILDGIALHAPALASREAQYIPHASTWLRAERWTDQVEQQQPRAGPQQRKSAFEITMEQVREEQERNREHIEGNSAETDWFATAGHAPPLRLVVG